MSHDTKVRVVLVDDDATSLALLRSHVSRAGYEIVTATNGREALNQVRAEGAAIVITDWMMPEMSGLELCRAIRSMEGSPYLYVIVLTAEPSKGKVVEAFDAGADDFLSKPFDPPELLARIRAGERVYNLQQVLERHSRDAHRTNAEMAVNNTKLAEAYRKLNLMATTDELTGLFNRREAMTRLQDHWSASMRHGDAMACIAIDIDHFKACNDTYGHAVGDLVLKETADALRQAARRGESVCRLGGEEFLVICPHATESMAEVAAERIRRSVENRLIRHQDHFLRVTISAGVAERTPVMTDPEALMRAADAALYAAKHAGRNIVCLAGRLDEFPGVQSSDDRANRAVPYPARPSEISEPRTKILIADVDSAARLNFAGQLRHEGYVVVETASAADLISKATQDSPEVVLVDAELCQSNGFECVRRLKSDPRTQTIPIILMTTRRDGRELAAIREAGVDEVLVKSVHPQELSLRVHTMARYHRELVGSNAVRGEQSRALDLLVTFSRDIAAAQSLDSILDATVQAVAVLTCSRRVAVLLPDALGTVLNVARCVGIDEAAAATLRIPVGHGMTGRVFASREKIFLSSPEESRARRGDPDYELFPGTPCVVTPLCAPECAVGVLSIAGRQQVRPFTEADLEYMDLICNIAAAAIHESISRKARDEARDSIVVALAKLAESRDTDTGRHLERVTRFCTRLAEQLREHPRYRNVINDEFLADFARAVPLHDIGKVAVPDHILRKPGILTAEETTIMRMHAETGARTLRSVVDRAPGARFLVMAEQIARSHHEWHNGQGYPQGLRGAEIPLPARIAAVADVYDALTTRRVYKDAIPHDEAADILCLAAGTQFDPDVIDAFKACGEEFRCLSLELADQPLSEPAVVPENRKPLNLRDAGGEPATSRLSKCGRERSAISPPCGASPT